MRKVNLTLLLSFFFKNQKKKKNDFLIYYKKHKNKEILFPYDLVKKIIKIGFKVSIVGDRLRYSKVKNYGQISNKKVSNLQSISRYTIASEENLYSIFTLECLSNNVKVIINKKIKIKNFKKFY